MRKVSTLTTDGLPLASARSSAGVTGEPQAAEQRPRLVDGQRVVIRRPLVEQAHGQRFRAQALAGEIREEGFPALVITPRSGDEAYRVVVGPYPSRESAESAGRRLGRPSFIYHP